MLCEYCGIELNEETRSWPVHTLCHVCETNDWWSSYGGISDTIQPVVNTGSLGDAAAMNLAYVLQTMDNLGCGKYKSKFSNRGARVDVKSTKRECDTCGHSLPNNFEMWKTKCYHCYKLFKDGTLSTLSIGLESKVNDTPVPRRDTKHTKSSSTQNKSDMGDINNDNDEWVVVTNRRKVNHLDKIRVHQEKQRAIKEQRAREEAKYAEQRAEQRAREEAKRIEQDRKLQVEMEYWNKIREARERERQEQIEREKFIARMSESNVIVKSAPELIHLPQKRSQKLCLAPTLIRPVLHEFYTDTIIEMTMLFVSKVLASVNLLNGGMSLIKYRYILSVYQMIAKI